MTQTIARRSLVKPAQQLAVSSIELFKSELAPPPPPPPPPPGQGFDCSQHPELIRCTNGETSQGITFNELQAFGSTFNHISVGGLNFDLTSGHQDLLIWGANGSNSGVGFTTNSLYTTGGDTGMISISRVGGGLFQALSFDISNGWGGSNPNFAWVREYLNGSPTGIDFDLTLSSISRLDLFGATFDEVRVTDNEERSGRDVHQEDQYGAPSIDNITFQ